MSGKKDKKTRQAIKRQLREFDNKVKQELNSLMKPCPAWCPEVVWFTLARIFLNN